MGIHPTATEICECEPKRWIRLQKMVKTCHCNLLLHTCYCLANHHNSYSQPDLPDLPLSNARNVASYTLFLTYMDSRSSRAMVVIWPLVLLIFSQFAGSDNLEYLHAQRRKNKDMSLNPKINTHIQEPHNDFYTNCYLNASGSESFILLIQSTHYQVECSLPE